MATSLLVRPDEIIFASSAVSGEVKPFPDIARGWGLTFDDVDAGGNGGFPPVEWFNFLLERVDAATNYFLQRGVAEWASTTLYAPGSVVSLAPLVYRALKANSNIRPGTDSTAWSQLADASSAVQLAPPGMVGLFMTGTVPAGWLKCNGASLSRTTYAALFGAIGTTFGGSGTTFNVPDARGEFPRFWDDGRGVDKTRALGSWQDQDITPHNHGGTAVAIGDHTHGASAWTDVQGYHGHYATTDQQGNHTHTTWTDAQGDHAHGAWTDAQGNHQHTLPNLGSVQAGGDNGGANAPVSTGYSSGRYQSPTDWAGNHSHSVGMNNAGNHAHNVSMNGAGVHGHNISVAGDGNHQHNVGVSVAAAGGHAHSLVTDYRGSVESRPRNLAFLACIKY